jgi:pantothenate kinase
MIMKSQKQSWDLYNELGYVETYQELWDMLDDAENGDEETIMVLEDIYGRERLSMLVRAMRLDRAVISSLTWHREHDLRH